MQVICKHEICQDRHPSFIASIWLSLDVAAVEALPIEVCPQYRHYYNTDVTGTYTVNQHISFVWCCAGAVGCSTVLQAGRSRVRFPIVSLEFFIDIFLPGALYPWG
jgi:hypothetical protein